MKETINNEKRIEVVNKPVSVLKDELGNPRKITRKKASELQESLESLGDFGIIVIDENDNIISGHQRVDALQSLYGDDHEVLCKRLVGYSKSELKAINIKANTHSGDWDLDKLAEWTADLHVDLGLDLPNQLDPHEDVKIKDMELKQEMTYKIVGSTEANSLKGKISNESPVGKALMGGKVGDTVKVETPAGVIKYKVLEIQRA